MITNTQNVQPTMSTTKNNHLIRSIKNLMISKESHEKIGSHVRFHLKYNIEGNIVSGSLDLPIIQSNLEPEVLFLIQATSKSLFWRPSDIEVPTCKYPLTTLSAFGSTPSSGNAVVTTAELTTKQNITKAKTSSGKLYKKTARGTNVFVGGGSNFYGIAKKPKHMSTSS